MPYEWNNILVVTKEELIPEFFPSWGALKAKLWRDSKKTYGMRRAQEGKGLGNEVLIQYDTLPVEIRKALGDPREVDCILERYFREDRGAVEYYTQVKAGKKGYIEAERQQQYILDASVLLAAFRLRDARTALLVAQGDKSPMKNMDKYLSEAVNVFNAWRNRKHLLEHNLPTNYLSLKRKMERFEKEGYASLLKGYDNNNASVKTEKQLALLRAMYIQKEKPTMVEVYRLYDAFLNGYVDVINPETGEIYDPSEYGKMSQRTVTMFLASWKEKVATHLKRAADRQQYMAKFDAYQSLEQPEFAGSIISIDDRQPPFEYAQKMRMWFYNAIDLGSECIIAFVYGKSKDGIIMDFYRELVRNCAEWGINMPAELECEAHLNSNFKDTFLREGCMFQYVRILANSAHSKRIERYYGNLRYQLEKKRAGWLGRPNARNEAYQRNGEKTEIIPYDTLVRNCLEDIMTWNNMPHSKYPEKTRWEVFMERQHPDLHPINWRGILPYIGERTQTSCRAGQIRLNSGWYLLGDNGEIYTGDPLLGLMEQIEGKDVDVCWLRGHNGQTLKALVYLNNRLVCEALPKPVAKRSQLEARGDANAKDNFELMERYKNTIRGWARRHKNEIEKLIIVDNRPQVLNHKFTIPWENMYGPDPQEVEPEDTEILTEPEEELQGALNGLETGYKHSTMLDRF